MRPEARSYYELSAAKIKFNLPKPGFLDGVKSRVRHCQARSGGLSALDIRRTLIASFLSSALIAQLAA